MEFVELGLVGFFAVAVLGWVLSRVGLGCVGLSLNFRFPCAWMP